jgi:hypothetical protein
MERVAPVWHHARLAACRFEHRKQRNDWGDLPMHRLGTAQPSHDEQTADEFILAS